MGFPSTLPIAPTIALASYRGARFIERQIESIQAQTHRDWKLLIRDDASDDETVSIVEKKAATDDRIEILRDDAGRLGVLGNYSRLLSRALEDGARWVALCDQDDEWLPHKLESQLRLASSADRDSDRPRLIHSDLGVVGPDLEPAHPSLHRLMGIRHEANAPLGTLLVQNFVTGCSALANRALLEMALPVPPEAVMVDWWLALCAAATGEIDFDPEPSVLYRQHEANTLGARPLRGAILGTLRRTLSRRRHDPTEFHDTLRQANGLEQRLAAWGAKPGRRPVVEDSCAFVSDYLDLFRRPGSRVSRVLAMRRLGIRRQNRLLDAMLKVRLLGHPIDPDFLATLAPRIDCARTGGAR